MLTSNIASLQFSNYPVILAQPKLTLGDLHKIFANIIHYLDLFLQPLHISVRYL